MSSHNLGVLTRLTVGFNKFGNIEVVTEGVSPGELLEAFEDWNPGYENTHVVVGLQKLATALVNNAKQELTNYVNSHEIGSKER